jgi:hypothetical protein
MKNQCVVNWMSARYLIPTFAQCQARPNRCFQIGEGDSVGDGQEHRLQKKQNVMSVFDRGIYQHIKES